jgi:hypothetical protein
MTEILQCRIVIPLDLNRILTFKAGRDMGNSPAKGFGPRSVMRNFTRRVKEKWPRKFSLSKMKP